jgi:prevent-host-death family protein
MSRTVNIHEAKTHLSRLVEQAAAGQEVIIARAGKPLARLVPLAAAARPKKLGQMKGQFQVPADFNAPFDAGALELFEGG